MNAFRAMAALATGIVLAGCSPEVIYVDWKIDRLCAKDGGLRVFETAEAPRALLHEDGSLDLNVLQRTRPEDPYFLEHLSETLKRRAPEIIRSEYRLWRSSDRKLIATTISYIRPTQNVGVPIFSHQAYTCPSAGELYALATAVFSRHAPR